MTARPSRCAGAEARPPSRSATGLTRGRASRRRRGLWRRKAPRTVRTPCRNRGEAVPPFVFSRRTGLSKRWLGRPPSRLPRFDRGKRPVRRRCPVGPGLGGGLHPSGQLGPAWGVVEGQDGGFVGRHPGGDDPYLVHFVRGHHGGAPGGGSLQRRRGPLLELGGAGE